MAKSVNASPIQQHIEIKEIKNDVVVLKNGALRAILMTNSLNFFLKSVDEQKALVLRFQDFLNSLDFSIQILINSRKFDITEYIAFLAKQTETQTNQLLQLQTFEYIEFIKGLTKLSNIMSDNFYVIVPYSPTPSIQTGFFKNMFNKKKHSEEFKKKSDDELKNSLWQRVEFVITGLQAMNIRAVPLETNELIELFYRLYNPGAREEISKSVEIIPSNRDLE